MFQKTLFGLLQYACRLQTTASCVVRFIFEAAGIRSTIFGALIEGGAQVLVTFEFHRFVNEDLHGVCHSFKAIFGNNWTVSKSSLD